MNGNLQWHIHARSGSLTSVSRSNWNLEMKVLVEGGKPENPAKPLGAGARAPHKASTPGFQPGPHFDGRRPLSPLHHPCSPKYSYLDIISHGLSTQVYNGVSDLGEACQIHVVKTCHETTRGLRSDVPSRY